MTLHGKTRRLPFAVDAALLRELGERLVGRAHIALAELIKNAYDADATIVDVAIAGDEIVVRDNGHGMTYDEFARLWMRIGSTHKERQEVSRGFKRPLTGSKGVGRLAAQFLAHTVELRSSSVDEPDREVEAVVDWDEALRRDLITQAQATVTVGVGDTRYAAASSTGTSVTLRGLKQPWSAEELRDVAQELWPLQPPFDRLLIDEEEEDEQAGRAGEGTGERGDDDRGDETVTVDDLLAELDEPPANLTANDPRTFVVRLRSTEADDAFVFEQQMQRVLDLWSARITGRLAPSHSRQDDAGTLEVEVEFRDGEVIEHDFQIGAQPVHTLAFEIRVFDLHHRQRYGISVDEARNYLRRNGGVHVYDAGFHLPYYGAESDWLNIERDHANRLSASELLPRDMQVRRGLQALPTNRRLFGVVEVDTAAERRATPAGKRTGDALTIQVSRDRLVDNRALRSLSMLVRTALDFYAVTQTRRNYAEIAKRTREPAPAKARRFREVLSTHRRDIAPEAYAAISREVDEVVEAARSDAEHQAAQVSLLAPLATAGMTALSSQHEFSRQFHQIERIVRQLRRARDLKEVGRLVDQLEGALAAARGSRELFDHLLDPADQVRRVLRARPLLASTGQQLRHFMRGVTLDFTGVPDDFLLPPGSVAEWNSIFQNVFVNAVNAMLDADERRIDVDADASGNERFLRIQDTGSGVELKTAEALFEPFSRLQSISHDRRALGFGGTGLGLTIVRMLAVRLGCTAQFAAPDTEHSTSFELTWEAT